MKFKLYEKVRIISKSVNVYNNFLVGKIGKISEYRYNGKNIGYKDNFYYAICMDMKPNWNIYHFLECDLRSYSENNIIEFEDKDFEI